MQEWKCYPVCTVQLFQAQLTFYRNLIACLHLISKPLLASSNLILPHRNIKYLKEQRLIPLTFKDKATVRVAIRLIQLGLTHLIPCDTV